MNLDRFQPPNRNDERDYEREERIALEKADEQEDERWEQEQDQHET